MTEPQGWSSEELSSLKQVRELLLELKSKRWLCRGHSKVYSRLVPSIDRKAGDWGRPRILEAERSSIDVLRATAHAFGSAGEENLHHDDVIALMVLRHHGVPTRLLDWSGSPYVAAFFAVRANPEAPGELWAFDHDCYAEKGAEQWIRWPETTRGGSGHRDAFEAGLTAFLTEEPPDWIIAASYPLGFPRQTAQEGSYTMAARFGVDHAESLARLLDDPSTHVRYEISSGLKPEIAELLRSEHGIWRGSLFPDVAGASQTAAELSGLADVAGDCCAKAP